MDRHLRPHVTYWTGVWRPSLEAVSKEVDILRRRNGRLAPVVSFALDQPFQWRRHERVLTLGGHQYVWLHVAGAALERRGDITHAFGAVDGWHLLRVLGRRPLVYTAAISGVLLDRSIYGKVAIFAAESLPIADALMCVGVPASKIEIVYPGIDLSEFSPSPAPPLDRFRLLFASTPAKVDEFDERGIPLMVEAARHAPDVDFVFLWRKWGDVEAARRALAALHPPANVIVDMRDAPDMPTEYRTVHATICCYADGFGKSCPNSLVEGLACGRPAIVSGGVGVAKLVSDHGAGVVVPLDVEGVLTGIREVRRDGEAFSHRARALAEAVFGMDAFTARYAAIYERVMASPTAGAEGIGRTSSSSHPGVLREPPQ
jgi:glycosyltransferase involved in cell wall biosynthesis